MEQYVLDKNKHVHRASFHEWARALADPAHRTVAHTVLGPGKYVRTVFTGINHCKNKQVPLVFKTSVVGGHHYQEYFHTTWSDALNEHVAILGRFAQGATTAMIIATHTKPVLHLIPRGTISSTRRPPRAVLPSGTRELTDVI